MPRSSLRDALFDFSGAPLFQFVPVIPLAAGAIDPVTFKYWKWKWLKAHQNPKVIERLWSSGYDIGFPSL